MGSISIFKPLAVHLSEKHAVDKPGDIKKISWKPQESNPGPVGVKCPEGFAFRPNPKRVHEFLFVNEIFQLIICLALD